MLSAQEIIELSNKYPIDTSSCVSVFEKAAVIVSPSAEVVNELGECGNHLDEDFMALLEKGVHLDLSILPLSI